MRPERRGTEVNSMEHGGVAELKSELFGRDDLRVVRISGMTSESFGRDDLRVVRISGIVSMSVL